MKRRIPFEGTCSVLASSRAMRYVVPMLVVMLLVTSCGIDKIITRDAPATLSMDGLPRSADGRVDCDQAGASTSSWWQGLSPVASATSWVAFESVRDLTWASQSIVRGRIVQVCPLDMTKSDEAGQYREYVLAVDKVYRGQPPDRIVVRDYAYGGPVETGVEELVGDSVVMFLAPERDGAISPVGGPQGSWEIRDGRVWGWTCCSIVALTLSEFEQAVAFSLTEEPSDRMPGDPVSIADAPIGPDLPPAGVRPAGCGGILTSAVTQPHSEDLADLAWYSQQIIVGTVVEQLPPAPAEDVPGIDPIIQPVVTDYRIQVDERIRGLPVSTLRVRQIGGTFEDCTVTNQAGKLLAEGDQVLLFLSTPEPGVADPTYYPTNGDKGIWHFDDTGTVVSNWKTSVPRSYPAIEPPVIPMIELVEYFTTVLTNPPPRKYALIPSIIPPADAPITPPISWPDLPGDGTREWVRYEHPVDGWSLAYPSGWKLLAPGVHGGTTTFASYQTSGSEEEHLPDGGFRLDLYQAPGPTTQQPHPLSVGAGGYPGILTVGTGSDDGYRLSILYYAAGNHWRLTGWFDEPPTEDNPDTLLFFQIVDSITHNHPPPAS
ncbi:MAG TPA: hypothetical protein VFS96_09830 [Nitrolancea sp.]|nr:hypothetical protein [Nitrolancea sp.]